MKIFTFLCAFCTIVWSYSGGVNAYTIPNVKLELTETGFRVSIPDSPGLENVFFAIRVDDKCPQRFDLLSLSANRMEWANEYEMLLGNSDKLDITVMLQVNSEIYTSNQHIVIENKSITFVEQPQTNALVNNECDLDTFKLVQGVKECDKNFITQLDGGRTTNCVGDLLFEDNFNGGAVNEEKWTTLQRILQNDEITNEFVVVTNSVNNLYLSDGVLVMKPTLATGNIKVGSLNLGNSCTVARNESDCRIRASSGSKFLPPIYSSMIESKDHFSFQYGRIEIRAKLPQGDWLLPYVLLQSVEDNPYYPSQIRIAFARGNQQFFDSNNENIGGSTLFGGVVYWDNNNRMEQFRNVKQGSHFGSDYRVYTLIWTKDSIQLLVDGLQYGVINEEHLKNKFHEKYFIKMGVSAGGHLEYPDTLSPSIKRKNKKPWVNTNHRGPLQLWKERNTWTSTWKGSEALMVDYIRVYAV